MYREDIRGTIEQAFKIPIVKKAYEYVEYVLKEDSPTGWEIRAQCQIIKDMWDKKQYEEDYPYYFDIDEMKKIYGLLSLMNFATGFVAGQPVLKHLSPYQAFFIVNLFGWRHKDRPYKFKHSDITLFVARKNSKTGIVAIIFILLMLTEQDYSEFYSICINRDLAGEVRKAMVQILGASPHLAKHFNVSQSALGKLECKITHCFFQPRVSQAGANNGIRPCAFLFDEAGNFQDRSNWDAMCSGQKSVLNPLRIKATTAYATDNSIMIPELDYCDKVFKNVIEDDKMFALIYRADFEHLWDDIGMYQANPLEVEANYEVIRSDRQKALLMPEAREEYLTKSMNYFLPSNAGDTYVDPEDVKKCSLSPKDFDWKDRKVYLGADLALTGDNVAISMVTYADELEMFVAEVVAFIPVLRLDEKIKMERCDYRRYIAEGHCVACGDRTISYTVVEDYVLNIEERFGVDVIGIGYDKWNCTASKNRWESFGYICTEVAQHSRVTYPAAKRLREDISNHRFRFIENGLLEENFANAKKIDDQNMGFYVSKKQSMGKVDMVVATINAIVLWLLDMNDGTRDIYEHKRLVVL